jgi:hypothetical protein
MSDVLDLVILDSGFPGGAVIYARCGSDVATARLPLDSADLRYLDDFRRRIERALYGDEAKPSSQELEDFGHKLFEYLIHDDVRRLYDGLPKTHLRVLVLSDCAAIQTIPWEYFQEPGQSTALRSVVRVVKTIGVPAPPSLDPSSHIRVLFAYANPQDQEARVDWEGVRLSIEQTLQCHHGDRYTLDVINAVTRPALIDAINGKDFDVFHFSGHGTVVSGVGRLILDRGTSKSSYITGPELSDTLSQRGIRLVILSACHGASGDFSDDFSVIAKTLVERGLPAVVANQMPVYNSTMAPFVGTLYVSLLRDGDLDRAVHRGRLAIKTNFDDDSLAPVKEANLDWGVPTLYRHISAAHMFDFEKSKV